jgi:acyl carrier protein
MAAVIIKAIAKWSGMDTGSIDENTLLTKDLLPDKKTWCKIDREELKSYLYDVTGQEISDEELDNINTVGELINYFNSMRP